MADRVIRGYWDCPQCGTTGIDGLVDVCPNCGAGKDKNVRYYMKAVEEVTEEELQAAGTSKAESDGSHREWICAYCGNLNNYADEVCVHCGANKEEKEQDYGGDTQKIQYRKDKYGNVTQENRPAEPQPSQSQPSQDSPAAAQIPAVPRKSSPFSKILLLVAALAALFLLWPHTESEAITGFEWYRQVTVEELQTFSESGWSLPYGARQTDARREFYTYQQVLDHYETVYETRTRQVLDHYETSYTYTDNGNGTFSEHAIETPVYRTETYREPVQSPVYRTVPVYQTKYYYEVDRWVKIQDYETSGNDHEPYWSEGYTLTSNQRDTQRAEQYYTIYSGTDRQRVSYDKWTDQEIGDGVYVTKCRLGIEYSRKEK